MPFEGLFTWFDIPSDAPPSGALGKRVIIPSKWGVPALATLKGMAVNFDSIFMSKHASQNKIGIIEDTWVGDKADNGGTPVYVKGFIYAHDFPEEAMQIKDEQADLGFSYETVDTPVMPGTYEGEDVLIVCGDFAFSGGAIMLAEKAAYVKTSLAAQGESQEGGQSTLDLDQIIAAVIAALQEKFVLETKEDALKDVLEEVTEEHIEAEDKLNDVLQEVVEEHVEAETKLNEIVEDITKKPEAPAPELDASKTEDSKSEMKMPKSEMMMQMKAMADELKSLKAELEKTKADLKAEADAKFVHQHKGFEYPATLAAKYNFEASADTYEAQIAAVDARQDLTSEQKMALKFELRDKHLKNIKR